MSEIAGWKFVICTAAALHALACGSTRAEEGEESVSVSSTSQALTSETLFSFASKCDTAIGVTVPAFNCDFHADGTPVLPVPTTNFSSHGVAVANPNALNYDQGPETFCDRPNMLNRQCDPGSKFQVLFNDPSAVVVAHCRKMGSLNPNLPSWDPEAVNGYFRDIAVIQYNKKSGATCFYQNTLVTMSGAMPAPSSGDATRWLMPNANLAGDPCVNCHDHGPIIRSPYLAQITGRDQLPEDIFPMGPGSAEQAKRNLPYYFVGNDFAGWRSYQVDVPGGVCVMCHTLARNNRSNLGTAIDFAQRATALSLPQKNAISLDSPPWMPPGQTDDAQVGYWRTHADLVTSCAQSPTNQALPYNANCRIRRLSKYPSVTGSGSPFGFERQGPIAELPINNIIYNNNGQVMELAADEGGSFGRGNLTALFGAPVAASSISGVVTADSYNAFYYRGGTRLYEVAYKQGLSPGWEVADITSLTGSPAQLLGNPVAYVPPYLTVAVLGTVGIARSIYRYEINLDGTSWSARNLSGPLGAPGGSNPFGFQTSNGYDDVIYVSTAGDIWELGTQDGANWFKFNVTASVAARRALGAARPYLRSDGVNAIVYRDDLNHVSELSFATGDTSWTKRDLFAEAGIGSQQTLLEPVPYVHADGTNGVLFVDSATQHLYELGLSARAFRTGSGWFAADLTSATGVPSNPTSSAHGYTRSDGISTVVFKGTGSPAGRIFQLRFSDGAWQPYDAALDSLTPSGP